MNLDNQLDYEELRKSPEKYKKVFFYRVCGTGMGAAACLLKEKGLEVEGADTMFAPPMSTYLESTGIPLHKLEDINEELLSKFDLIVVGNVVPRNSEDAKRIENCGTPFISFPSALGALVLEDVNVVGIAGTHGKTTTTFFATQMFEALGEDPGYFIGGVMEGRPSSRLGNGKYFFIESDEYDSAYFEKISKFRRYSIDSLILTSLEFDHADIFDNIEDIKDEFRALLPDVKKHILASNEYPAIKELENEFPKLKEQWEYYGSDKDLGPRIKSTSSDETSFDVCISGEWVEFKTNVIGPHNIQNLTPLVLFAHDEGFSIPQIQKSIEKLELVKRRQEVRGIFRESLVIDDFAHHPRSVDLTIEAIKIKYPNKKLTVVMEPNSATARSSIFQKEFEEALSAANHVIFTKPNRPTSVKFAKDLDYELIINNLSKRSISGGVAKDLSELLSQLEPRVGEDNIFLILSNGTCLGLWQSSFVDELKKP